MTQRKKPTNTTGLITKQELSSALNLSISSIENYQQAGMPVAIRGKQGIPNYYDLQIVTDWIADNVSINKAPDYDEAKLRKLTADAQLAEVKLAQEVGELIKMQDAVNQVSATFSRIRSKLLAIPSNLSGVLYTMDNQREVNEYLDHHIRQILEELIVDIEGMEVGAPQE